MSLREQIERAIEQITCKPDLDWYPWRTDPKMFVPTILETPTSYDIHFGEHMTLRLSVLEKFQKGLPKITLEIGAAGDEVYISIPRSREES